MKITIKVLFIALFCMFFSCKKDVEIKGTRDLKNLPLPELKNFLSGKWRLHYFEDYTFFGLVVNKVPDSNRAYLVFYPVDSIRREATPSNIVIREKLIYKYEMLPGMESLSTYVLFFDQDFFGYRNKWTADYLKNDTLVFANYFQSEGIDRFYYTKEK